MKRNHPLLVAALLLSSCTASFHNVRVFELHREDAKALVTIQEDFCWRLGYVDGQGKLHIIQAQLDALGTMEQLVFSPGRQKVIVESSGEGHQHLSVYLIKDLVQEPCGVSGFIPAYRTLDPYPYSFEGVRWLTDDCIQFWGYADMSRFDGRLRRGKTDFEEGTAMPRLWRWHLETDTFESVDSHKDSSASGNRTF